MASPAVSVAPGPWAVIVSEADLIQRAEALLHYSFQNPDLLRTAFTHSSLANTRIQSNERLEFLGDAVLGLLVCDELFQRFAEWNEGDLTKVKSVVVSRRICARIADEIGLTDLLMLGNGMAGGHHLPTSLRAAVFESVVGALYLDAGLDVTRQFVTRAISEHLNHCAASENQENYKSALQQFAQHYLQASPVYESLDEQGPDHSKCFEVGVVINGERYPSAWGPSKKHAEQEAAHRALEILRSTNNSSEAPIAAP